MYSESILVHHGVRLIYLKTHQEYLETGKAQTLASPTTTLGNISSWVAHDLQSSGPEISHSITCSTALHAVLKWCSMAEIRNGYNFLVGGSETPLTDFTIAQMKALKIYSDLMSYTQTVLDLDKTQNMILGEGAGVCCLEMGKKKTLAYIEELAMPLKF
jgi:3-oxoacyl-(acyl-carrier-protein) synthase